MRFFHTFFFLPDSRCDIILFAMWSHSSAGEHLFDVQRVGGSIPSDSTIEIKTPTEGVFFITIRSIFFLLEFGFRYHWIRIDACNRKS
jgi:hypothetical protein